MPTMPAIATTSTATIWSPTADGHSAATPAAAKHPRAAKSAKNAKWLNSTTTSAAPMLSQTMTTCYLLG